MPTTTAWLLMPNAQLAWLVDVGHRSAAKQEGVHAILGIARVRIAGRLPGIVDCKGTAFKSAS